MDGLLVVDKPSGPTSHDVVARARRALREKRIGHTGTLDPMASGVLPLVVGKATRLARFLPGDKAYDAVVRLGLNTDTYDAQGEPVGPAYRGPWPTRSTIEAALAPYRGTFLQQPPAYSAKKIAGRRSYDLARQAKRGAAEIPDDEPAPAPVLPEPVSVSTRSIELLDAADDMIQLRVRCSAGFYIRSLAFDLGVALGTGAHLTALRRIEAAGFALDRTVTLDRLQADDGLDAAMRALIPLEEMVGAYPTVSLTHDGVAHVKFGRSLGPADASAGFVAAVAAAATAGHVRLLDPSGHLVAMAEPAGTPGLLHPAVVLL